MGAVRTIGGAVVLLGFVSALAVRPLLSNPAISTALEDGLFTWTTLLALPVVLIVVVLVGYRIWSLLGTDETADADTHWDVSPPEKPRETDHSRDSGATDDESDVTAESTNQSASYRTSYLTGQGGTRNREFELEEEPPDTDLQHHFEHLQAELGNEDSHESELDTMAEVVAKLDEDRVLPDRCPQPHCEAPWTEPAFLRDPSGNFEVLDDGKTVLCLKCEQTVTLAQEIDG
jgi:hypothetical protein